MRSIGIRIVFACALVMAISGCETAPGKPRSDSALVRPEEELRFDVLYSQNCAGCHGKEGKNGAAVELADPVYQAWVDDASLRTWITKGMPQTQMPAFAISAGGPLTDQQIDVLVHGMRQYWARAAVGQFGHLPPYLQPADGDINRGKQVFERSCAGCHEGSKQEVTGPTYLALLSDQALRTLVVVERLNIERSASQLKILGGPLSDKDTTDVVKYLGSLRIATPGQPYPGNREGAE